MIGGSTMFRPFEGPCLRSRLTYSEDVEEKGCGGLALSPVIKRQHWHRITSCPRCLMGTTMMSLNVSRWLRTPILSHVWHRPLFFYWAVSRKQIQQFKPSRDPYIHGKTYQWQFSRLGDTVQRHTRADMPRDLIPFLS